MKPLLPAIELYSAFTKYVIGEQAPKVLPLLQYMVEHGNTTVYEWTYGEPPLSVEPDPVHIEVEPDTQAAGDQVLTFIKFLYTQTVSYVGVFWSVICHHFFYNEMNGEKETPTLANNN